MNKYTIQLFNLPEGLWIDTIEKIDEKIIIKCRSTKKYAICPHCKMKTKKMNQYRIRYLKHGNINNTNTVIQLSLRQFICKNHLQQKTFMEKIQGIDRRRTTSNFRRLTMEWLQRNSFRYIGNKFSVSGSSLARMVRQNHEEWKIDWVLLAEKKIKLGIDEHSFRGRDLSLTLTEVKQRKLLSILPNDRLVTLEAWLENMPEFAKKQIDEVCMDLKVGYKNTVEKILPHAQITADRFHVEQLANRVVDEMRSVVVSCEPRRMYIKEILLKGKEKLTGEERIKLNMIFKKYEKFPCLYEAWFVKEKLRDMYRARNKSKAQKIFEEIISLLEDSHYSRYFETFKKTLKLWNKNILNYFNHYTTNAYTEGAHTKIKLMKRVSYGFRNIHNYIAKMMLAFLPLCWILNHHTI